MSTNPTSTTDLNEWVEHIMGGFTEDQLKLAFDLVSNDSNWKLPISQRFLPSVTIVTRQQVLTAIDFYAGGGGEITEDDDGGWTVTAPGYYEIIGS